MKREYEVVGDRCDEGCNYYMMDGRGFHCKKTGKLVHIFSKTFDDSISALMEQCPLEEENETINSK